MDDNEGDILVCDYFISKMNKAIKKFNDMDETDNKDLEYIKEKFMKFFYKSFVKLNLESCFNIVQNDPDEIKKIFSQINKKIKIESSPEDLSENLEYFKMIKKIVKDTKKILDLFVDACDAIELYRNRIDELNDEDRQIDDAIGFAGLAVNWFTQTPVGSIAGFAAKKLNKHINEDAEKELIDEILIELNNIDKSINQMYVLLKSLESEEL